MSYQDFPKVMHHPQHKPATHKVESREGLPKGMEPGTYDATPAFLPDVTVHTPDQEAQYASKGYLPMGVSDPEAYMRATIGAAPPDDHVFHEYPKWKYHLEEEPRIVANEAEERELGATWANSPAGPFPEPVVEQEPVAAAPAGAAPAARATRRRGAAAAP
jgi:hypothetical protein